VGTGLWVAVAALVAATTVGLLWRRANGRMKATGRGIPDGLLPTLGVEAGVPATLLQFSSAFCAPCRATRAICADVAARVPGVRHVEVDAESHLDAVRALGIVRTPTLLVVDADGRITRRATGQPSKAQVMAAVADLVRIQSS